MGSQLEALDRLMKAYQTKCIQVVRLQHEVDAQLAGPAAPAIALLIDARHLVQSIEDEEGARAWLSRYQEFINRYDEEADLPKAQS